MGGGHEAFGGDDVTPEEFEQLDGKAKRAIRAGLSDLGKAACDYCDLGWSILPLVAGAKVPIEGSGVSEACDDWENACFFWMNNPDCNIGIATGTASGGIIVIDVDQNEDAGKYGAESLADWEHAHGKLPETVCADSGSGGKHYFFRTGTAMKSSTNRTLCIDRRADSGYVVAPPSVHPDGGKYEWDIDPFDNEVAFANDRVLDLIAYCDAGDGSGNGEGKFEFPEVVHDGEGRESNLVSYAFSLRTQGKDYNEILMRLTEVNAERIVPPKPPHDLRRIAKSACRKPAGLSPEYAAAKERAEARRQAEAETAAAEYAQRTAAAEAAGVSNPQDIAPINPDDYKIGKNGLDHAAVGEDMMSRFHFRFIDGAPAVWTGAGYEIGWNPAKKLLKQYKRTIRDSERKEVCAWLTVEDPQAEQAPWYYIAFSNGVLNIKTMEMSTRTPDLVIPNVVPHDWNPEASSPLLNKFLTDIACGDDGVLANLCEMMGLSMCRSCFMDKAFFIVNNRGANGKSTFINFLRGLLGEENCSSVDPQIMGRRFQTTPMMGKLANIADDIPSSIADADGLAILKKAITGDYVPYEIKNGISSQFKPYCTFVFTMNEVPPLSDSSGGMIRRIHPVPFSADFRGRADRFLSEKLDCEECYEAAVVMGVMALCQMLDAGKVTETEFSRYATESIELDNNQVKLFLAEHDYSRDSLLGYPTANLYAEYGQWADDNGVRNVFSSRRFSSKVKSILSLEVDRSMVGGRRVFRYCEIGEGGETD